jgi:hypothetical protein
MKEDEYEQCDAELWKDNLERNKDISVIMDKRDWK